jgi:excinuclease ABC subunit A
MLVKVFDRLVEQGNTVLVIEHNLEVIKCADYVLISGRSRHGRWGWTLPKARRKKWRRVDASHTGRFLRGMLGGAMAERRAPNFRR